MLDLLPHHKKELIDGSGLSEETVLKAGIRSETNVKKVKTLLNWSRMSARSATGIVFPFPDQEGKPNGYCRFKPDSPRKDRASGKPVKYESPRGAANHVYYPPSTISVLADVSVPLLITEGEKKSLKADQDGFRCIGLVGVFGWKPKNCERLLPELGAIPWKGRSVFIVFDSDAAEKENVADAERRLAAQLTNHGAVVKIVRLPAGSDGAKFGLDDFLVANGANALHRLINEAVDPDPVEGGEGKAAANTIDAVPEARRLLAASAMHKEGRDDWPKLRYHRGTWWWWTGTHYRPETDADLEAKTVQYLHQAYYKLTKTAVGNVVMGLRAETNISSHVEMPSWLDGKREGVFLPMKNGILDVGRGTLIPHTPRFFCQTLLPYPFDPQATCPKWLAFLQHNLEGDIQRIAILQEFYGYTLTPSLQHHKFLLMEGDGSNGKSVSCAALAGMLGEDNVSAVPLEEFSNRYRLHTTIGKLANIVAEIGEVGKVDEGTLKAFTSGDVMQFEQKFRDPITARPTAKLVFATNKRPTFNDRSSGTWRRMILMPWRVVIQDHEKVAGMDSPDWWQDQGELPGILLWAIEGLTRLQQQGGFTNSAICETALDQYRMDSNPARVFLEEQVEFLPDAFTPCERLYSRYRNWATESGFAPVSANAFGDEIRKVFPKAQRKPKMVNKKRGYAYAGLRFRSTVENESPDT
jgi:putative DNA primase/helicase